MKFRVPEFHLARRARRPNACSRNFQDSRGLRITEPLKHDKQQSLPLFEREGLERSREFAARRSLNRQISGGARPARGEIFLLHMSLAAHPSGRNPCAVPFREQRIEVEMEIAPGQPQRGSSFPCFQQNRLDKIVGDLARPRLTGNERAAITAKPRRA